MKAFFYLRRISEKSYSYNKWWLGKLGPSYSATPGNLLLQEYVAHKKGPTTKITKMYEMRKSNHFQDMLKA